jgi:hypothetical protein
MTSFPPMILELPQDRCEVHPDAWTGESAIGRKAARGKEAASAIRREAAIGRKEEEAISREVAKSFGGAAGQN